jgi:hypothetical protein
MTLPEHIDLSLDDLTVGEIEEIEDLLDMPLDALSKEGTKRGKFMRALAFISVRRTNPEFTWEEAGNIKVRDITGDERPTSADEPSN